MDAGGTVSRRTRSQLDAYYRRLHDTIKNPDGGGTTIKGIQESEIRVDDDDDDEMKKKRKYKAGSKKRARKLDLDFGDARENEESGLPLKFKLDDEQSPKTESEMEIDRLFDDLELGLWESTRTTDFDECSDVDQSPAARCSRNDHDEFLDEQIGIVCRFCHTLLLHIKYVFPPFCVESPEQSEWNCSSLEEESKNVDDDDEFKMSSDCGNLEWYSSSDIPSRGTVFDLIPSSDKEELYPHQLEGFEFIWRNIAGDIHLNNILRGGAGAGGGCIISHAPGTGKTRLTIVFLQTLMRLYPKCRPLIIAPRGMLLTWEHELKLWKAGIPFHNLNEAAGHARSLKILSWVKGGSILGASYRLFEELARCKDRFEQTLLESPSLVVLDEGHTPRNDHTLIWKALTRLATRRRIILSGTPFQNNFDELYNTLSLVNPRFIMKSRRGRGRKRKQMNEWDSLTRDDQGIKKLRAMIQPFVHIHKGTILHETLPGLKDSLIILKPTPLQQKLLEQNIARNPNFLEQSHLASLISVHPSLVAQVAAFANHKSKLKSLQSDPNAGVKTRFLINLIEISSRIHEKVLIFSEFIKPLLHIKKLLECHLGYKQGREVMYIDGDLSMTQRQRLITNFNDKNGRAKVLLASQRACCEGISLVGASRVVLLDVSWNPSVERQAVCRAYRLGQEKMVYVYHLITLMEANKYARQTEKDRISELVFSEGERASASCGGGVCEDKVLEAMVHHQGCGAMFERIVHQPKDSDLVKTFGFVDYLDSSTF
ncbi:SNF2 domain-containing protein CLASSY 3-like [Salvia miltiorrhiza]|uniref:SNF2 domain-containing protein CLASSY 3-like n=1 Tax=Salvia miltiorrhiza TaxID=226208 RepID=UPI0025AD28EE|nr:SNF2 domain-containing protein CLASSY 3-like [Salvia miltiorrhiza]